MPPPGWASLLSPRARARLETAGEPAALVLVTLERPTVAEASPAELLALAALRDLLRQAWLGAETLELVVPRPDLYAACARVERLAAYELVRLALPSMSFTLVPLFALALESLRSGTPRAALTSAEQEALARLPDFLERLAGALSPC